MMEGRSVNISSDKVEKSSMMEMKPENSISSDLVAEMEKMMASTDKSVEWPRWTKNQPSIYREPPWLKNMTSNSKDAEAEAYRPRVVSLGPFYHDDADLRPMEEHKRRAVLHIVKRSGKPLKDFFDAIDEVADELMDAYHDLDDKWRRGKGKADFVQVMVVDGCFLLEIMKGITSKEAPVDYSPRDPVFGGQAMLSLSVGVRSDMLVIGNQVPLQALYRLEAVWSSRRGITALAQCVKDINKMVLEFMCGPLKGGKLAESTDGPCLHPLDIFHKSFCGPCPPSPDRGSGVWESSMPGAVELRKAGIRFKKSKTVSVNSIRFKKGVLSLPELSINDVTKKIFLNFMTFERLHRDTGTIVTDYISFMNNIIDTERDAALLRSKGIIKNLLGSDKDTADFFNVLSRGAVLSPYSGLQDVRRQLNARYNNIWKFYFKKNNTSKKRKTFKRNT